jgi:hypothetical protein
MAPSERRVAYAIVWGAVFAISQTAITYLTILQLRAAGEPMLSPLVRLMTLAVSPALLVAAILTGYLALRGPLSLVPCVWMLCYGAGVCAATLYSYRILYLWGAMFVLAGAGSLFLPVGGRLLMLGMTFGWLHFVFAGLVWAIRHAEHTAAHDAPGPTAPTDAEYERLFRDPETP